MIGEKAPLGSGTAKELKPGTREFGDEIEKLNEGLIAAIEATNFSDEQKSELGHKIAQATLDFMQAHPPQS